jgi:hypothetical protein
MSPKKTLSFDALRQSISYALCNATDNREANKIEYSLHDIAMSGFACMFLQCPSLLEFQRRLEEGYGRSNLQTQFGIKAIPKNTTLREGLDEMNTLTFAPVFDDFLIRLQQQNQLQKYQFLEGMYLLPMDGTEYFTSRAVSCNSCLNAPAGKKGPRCFHKLVQAAIVFPGIKQVFPLMPEAIQNTDGLTKKDSEISAATRLMRSLKGAHPTMIFIRMGDSLYAHSPFIRETLLQGDHFLFSIKPGDHKHLTKELKQVSFYKHQETTKNQKITYEWALQQPLTAAADSPLVNVIRCRKVTVHKKTGEIKSTYIGTWITDLDVNENNIVKLVEAARTRWRIENECFNTLKNQGYAIEHNFGHGDKNLCFNFYILTLLAFFLQQIGDLCDPLYQQARKKAGTLRCFWQDIRALINRFLYASWYKLLEQMVDYKKHTFMLFPDG